MALCFKENASSLDICTFSSSNFGRKTIVEDLWQRINNPLWRANYKSFFSVTGHIDKRLDLIRTAYYVASLEGVDDIPPLFCPVLPTMLVQPAITESLANFPAMTGLCNARRAG